MHLRFLLVVNVCLCFAFVVSCIESEDHAFLRGEKMYKSKDWLRFEKPTTFYKENVWWNVFKKYGDWPYFRYQLNVSVPFEDNHSKTKNDCESLSQIFLTHRDICAGKWNTQIVQSQQTPYGTYVKYDFGIFKDRSVCQHSFLRSKGSYYRIWIQSGPPQECGIDNISEIPMKEEMFLFVDPIFWKGKLYNQVTLILMQDPNASSAYLWELFRSFDFTIQESNFVELKDYLKTIKTKRQSSKDV